MKIKTRACLVADRYQDLSIKYQDMSIEIETQIPTNKKRMFLY